MSFVNHNPVAAQSSKSAELVAKFADNVLKRGSKASSAIDVDVALTRAVCKTVARFTKKKIGSPSIFRQRFSSTCKTKIFSRNSTLNS